MTVSAAQRYVAEFLGTFGLVMSIVGVAVFSLNIPGVDATTRVLMIASGAGFGLAALIYALGDVSGGHFNPAVTIGMWVAGRLRARDVVPYILSQVAGAIVSIATIGGVAYGRSALWGSATGKSVALGSNGYSGGGAPYTVAWSSVLLFEVVLTFLFVGVILMATRPERSAKNLAPLGIGLTLLMAHITGIPIDGTSVNPARSFGPALLSAFWPGDRWAISQDWIFWVAPIVGAVLAAAVDRFLAERSA